MYQSYWGLRESPFRGGLDRSLFHRTPNHDEALARAQFSGRGTAAAGAAVGADRHRQVAVGRGLCPADFRRWRQRGARQSDGGGRARFSVEPGGPERFESLALGHPLCIWRRVTDHLIEARYERTQQLLLLDDASEAQRDVWDLILRLAQCDPNAASRMTIIVIASEDRLGFLPSRLLELAELAISLEPWEPADTAAFLEQSLRHAGRNQPVFTPAAARRLHELASGIPLRIKQLADLAMIAGAGLEQAGIDVNTVNGAV